MDYINDLTSTVGVSAVEVGSITSTTDAAIYDQPYQTWCGIGWTTNGITGTFGLTSCVSHNGSGECEKGEFRLTTVIGSTNDTAAEKRIIVCHETGHSFGLLHRDPNPADGCMMTNPVNADEYIYTTHDKDHLENDIS